MKYLKNISKLPFEQQKKAVEILKNIRSLECFNSYFEFFKDAWKIIEPTTKLILTPHIKYLCDIAEKNIKDLIYENKINYDVIIINIPPGESKSTIFTKILNAWIWLHDPSFKIITNSYSSDLSLEHSQKTRDIVTSDWYLQNWGDKVKLKIDMKRISLYGTTQTGIRMATSTGGSGTGFHCRLWIDDDPLNVKKAYQEVMRKEALNHSNKTVPSRVKRGFRIMVSQRLHEEDPSGDMLRKKNKKILHIKLPARLTGEVLPEEAKGLYSDGLLDPINLPESKLQEYEEELGTTDFNQQYMQESVPEGGNKIKEEWYKLIDEKEIPANLTWDMWIDGAYTKTTENDPTGILITAYKDKKLYIKFFYEKYMEMPELLKEIENIESVHDFSNKSKCLIEPKASGKSLKQLINTNNKIKITAVEISSQLVSEGKEARIQIAAPKVEAGLVYLVRGSWNDKFIYQVTKYPNAKHDEAVDLQGYATDHYFPKRSTQERLIIT